MQSNLKLNAVEHEVAFASDSITVWCYPELRLIYHQMHGTCRGTTFRDALQAGTGAMRRLGANAWLSDDRLNGPLPDADEQWCTSTWFEETKDAGWKYWAIVLPERAVGKLNLKRFAKLYSERGIESEMFSSAEVAMDWLNGRSRGV